MSPRTLVIVNPESARGATRRRWRRLEPRLRAALGRVEIEHTRAPRDAERLAREAVRAGVERLVVAGGDGTWAEVASGLLGAELGGYAELGLLPMGTGSDLARSLGLPMDPIEALDVLATGRARPIDAGCARFTASDGAPRTSYFLNVASCGVSSLTVELARRAPRWLGGRAAFAIGSVRALFSRCAARVALRVDGEPVLDERAVLVAVANGRQFGGGMRIAPEAQLDDGRFDVVCVAALAAPRLVAKLPKLYKGTHLSDPVMRSFRGACIEVSSADSAMPLELDGEPLGALPVRIDALPRAVRVISHERR